jgi:hypothetical protein
MKVDVTHCQIRHADGDLIATVDLVDENVVQVDIKSVLTWTDWLDLTDAVRRAMLLMEVTQP